MMRSSLSGIRSMAAVVPDGPGPIVARWRSTVPVPSASSSKDHVAPAESGSPTDQAKRRGRS